MQLTNVELTELLHGGHLPQFAERTESEVFKKMLEASNPYGVYTATDRIANVWVRTYATTGLDRLKARMNSALIPSADQDELAFKFDVQTSLMFQHFWASTAFMSISWAANRPSLYSGYLDGDDDYSQNLAIIALSRTAINSFLEGSLLIADGWRWSRSMSPVLLSKLDERHEDLLKVSTASKTVSDAAEAHWLTFLPGGVPGAAGAILPGELAARTAYEGALKKTEAAEEAEKASKEKFEKAQRRVERTKMLRPALSVTTFTGFVLNAVPQLAMASMTLKHAQGDWPEYIEDHGDNKRAIDRATASLLFISGVTSILTNAPKAVSSLGAALKSQDKLKALYDDPDIRGLLSKYAGGLTANKYKKLDNINKGFAITGTGFGVFNAAFGVSALAPNLWNQSLSDAEKGMVVAEIGIQVASMAGIFAFTTRTWRTRRCRWR